MKNCEAPPRVRRGLARSAVPPMIPVVDSPVLALEIPDADTWATHRAGLEGHGGLMVPVPEGQTLDLFTEVEVRITQRSHPKVTAAGRVVQIAPDGSAAVLFEGEAKETLLRLEGWRPPGKQLSLLG